MSSESNNKIDNWWSDAEQQVKKVSARLMPAFLGAALVLGQMPEVSNAVPSGGRSGGSSFGRSGGSMRSSTRLGGGYGGGYSSGYRSGPSVTIAPIGGFGYSPFYSPFGFGYSPFSFVPVNGNLLLLGGLAYIAYSFLSNRVGGSDFSTDEDAGSLGTGATVLKLQVALDSDWNDSNNIMNTLSQLAARKGNVSGRSEISSLLSEASIALLRKRESWSAAACEGERFRGGSQGKAEPFFQRIAVSERTKFDSESSYASGGPALIKSTESNKSGPTQAVVSLVVAIRGQSDALKRVSSSSDLSAVLQTLASEALTDEGENIMAVEVLWTPSDAGSTLSKRDLIVDYPELIQL